MAQIDSGVSRLLRPDVAELVPYPAPTPLDEFAALHDVTPEQVLKLDQNENPYGCSPRVNEALGRYGWYHVYPDPDHTALRHRLAAYVGAPAESIVVGNGSDELIELIFRLFVGSGDVIVSAAPTFGYYDTAAQAAGARYVTVDRGPNFEVDVESLASVVRRGAKLVLLASPNNPTGNATPIEVIRHLAELDAVVVVDEAYFEFCGKTALPLLTEAHLDNVIVLRTFSKWAGLAGLRLGYGLFAEPVVRAMRAIKPPYSVGQAAEVAGLASLDDAAFLRSMVERIVAERERLRIGLDALGFLRTYPSDANFILCDVNGKSAAGLQAALADRAILIRRYSAARLENCLRISVGRPEQTDRLLQVLRDIG